MQYVYIYIYIYVYVHVRYTYITYIYICDMSKDRINECVSNELQIKNVGMGISSEMMICMCMYIYVYSNPSKDAKNVCFQNGTLMRKND